MSPESSFGANLELKRHIGQYLTIDLKDSAAFDPEVFDTQAKSIGAENGKEYWCLNLL